MSEHACPNCTCKPAPPRLAEGWIHIRRDGSFAYSCDRDQVPCPNAFASAFVREVAECEHPQKDRVYLGEVGQAFPYCTECGAFCKGSGVWLIPSRQMLP
jgi:hypothetical protein